MPAGPCRWAVPHRGRSHVREKLTSAARPSTPTFIAVDGRPGAVTVILVAPPASQFRHMPRALKARLSPAVLMTRPVAENSVAIPKPSVR